MRLEGPGGYIFAYLETLPRRFDSRNPHRVTIHWYELDYSLYRKGNLT